MRPDKKAGPTLRNVKASKEICSFFTSVVFFFLRCALPLNEAKVKVQVSKYNTILLIIK